MDLLHSLFEKKTVTFRFETLDLRGVVGGLRSEGGRDNWVVLFHPVGQIHGVMELYFHSHSRKGVEIVSNRVSNPRPPRSGRTAAMVASNFELMLSLFDKQGVEAQLDGVRCNALVLGMQSEGARHCWFLDLRVETGAHVRLYYNANLRSGREVIAG